MISADLYKKVMRLSRKANIILSPFSISAALAMTYAGAMGKTRSQMHTALRYSDIPVCDVDEGYKGLLEALSATNHNHTLKVANRLFVDRHFRCV